MSEIHLAVVRVWPLMECQGLISCINSHCNILKLCMKMIVSHCSITTSTSECICQLQLLPRSSKHFRGLAPATFFCSALRRRFCWRRRFRSRFRRGVDRVCRVCGVCGRRPPETVQNQLADPSWGLTKISCGFIMTKFQKITKTMKKNMINHSFALFLHKLLTKSCSSVCSSEIAS